MKKYGAVFSDFHSGHLVGLTPDSWMLKGEIMTYTKRNKFLLIQKALWVKFEKILSQLPPLDFAFFMGDLIEGKGKKSGGTELITNSLNEQADMAVEIINRIRFKCFKKSTKTVAVFGTPYHTDSDGDECEIRIAERAFIDKIGSHEWVDVNGLVFDLKHHIGSSQIPHGRYTAVSKAALWNDIWSLAEMQPRADVILRGHVHYFVHCGTSDKLCMTLPALQGMGSKFGSKICEGLVDWGIILFEVTNKNNYRWIPYIHRIKEQATKAVKI